MRPKTFKTLDNLMGTSRKGWEYGVTTNVKMKRQRGKEKKTARQ